MDFLDCPWLGLRAYCPNIYTVAAAVLGERRKKMVDKPFRQIWARVGRSASFTVENFVVPMIF